MGCFGSKEAKHDGGSTELQTPNQQKTHGATGADAQRSAVASSGAGAGAGSGAGAGGPTAGSGRLDRAVRDKSNPLVYFDMEQGGESSRSCLCAAQVLCLRWQNQVEEGKAKSALWIILLHQRA